MAHTKMAFCEKETTINVAQYMEEIIHWREIDEFNMTIACMGMYMYVCYTSTVLICLYAPIYVFSDYIPYTPTEFSFLVSQKRDVLQPCIPSRPNNM